MRRSLLVVALVLALGALALGQGDTKKKTAAHAGHVTVAPQSLQWGPIPQAAIVGKPPADFKPRSQFAVVHGDPLKAGSVFTIRIKAPDGEKFPPHWHPQDENVTVLQGAMAIVPGEKLDTSAGKPLEAGGFVMMPKRTWHFAYTKGDTIIQVHGVGPFTINFNPMAPKPAKKATSE